ncbi:MAG: HEAT repeat domain-containing protein [Gemmatimonadota bacterium]|nr:HEAT repeat domain-containing protein [Gemmatimonadota bacterium]
MMNHKSTTNGRKSVMIAGTILALLIAADVTVMTAGHARAWEGGQLSAQENREEERDFLLARSLINRANWVDAAARFRQLREKYPKGRHVSDAFYWEAFARHRMGQLEQAHLLLDNMLEMAAHPETAGDDLLLRRVNDARQLRLRILGELAERGDSRAAEEVLRQSELTLGQAWDSIAAHSRVAWDSAATAMARAMDSLAVVMGPAMDSIEAAVAQEYQGAVERLERFRLDDAVVSLRDFEAALRFSSGRRELPEGCDDDSVQQEALTAVLRLVDTDRVRVLRGVIDREDECSVNLRVRAVELLAREDTGEAERELINVAMTHQDPRARHAAVTGLRRFDTPTAIAALVTVLTRSSYEETQEAAISALRRSESAEARKALEVYAADATRPEELREDAIVALGRRDDVEADVLIRLYAAVETEKLKSTLIDRLRRKVESGSKQGETWLFNLAFDSNEPSDIRSKALDAWGRSPSLELSGLVQAFGRLEDPDLRERIFYALYRRAGRTRDEAAKSEVVRKMVELARLETDDDVRERAVYWMGRTGSQEAVEYLLELLRGPPSG